ncbi:porin family protein [Chakrabartia godavariana]|nr:porin family protein [Chakrabartia godavariana]
MTKRFVAAVSCAPIAILASTAAHAENFQGFRVELHGGYDAISSEYTVDGATAGVGIGYDIPVGESVIVGVEANLDYSSAKDEGVYLGVAYSQVARRDIELSARVGAKLGEGTLAYLKAGYSNAGYEGAAAGYGLWAYEKGTSDGLRLGVGLEQRIADRWFVKGEYRYTRYGSEDVNRNQAIFGVGYRF